jgi:N-acetylmuramoyl-L-alanine amidase
MNVKNFKRDKHDPQEADFYILKNSNIPGVLVETAFITNSNDYKLLMQNDFKSMIGIAITDGIDNFINSK